MKIFSKVLMASEFDVSKLKAGVFYDGTNAQAEVEDGALVSILGLEDHDLYANTKDFNARKITAFDNTAPIYGFVDYVGVSHGKILGVEYRMGDSATCC